MSKVANVPAFEQLELQRFSFREKLFQPTNLNILIYDMVETLLEGFVVIYKVKRETFNAKQFHRDGSEVKHVIRRNRL